MDFFRSVFADEPDPYSSPSDSPNHPSSHEAESDASPNPSAWSFGGLIKTLATKSESVIETYRRDLDEFRSGLQKETTAFRDAASRAVKDLPSSLETGASVAQESLESVGQAIDDLGGVVWRGTAEIISQGREALLSADQDGGGDLEPLNSAPVLSSRLYSRFETQIAAIQSDPGTYCDEPEDEEDFTRWKLGLGFVLEEKAEEIQNLCSENGIVEAIYGKLVPSVVDQETFWSRYFYRAHKLKLTEDARANLVKRVISREDDEDLSWDVEDDDEGETADLPKNLVLEEKEVTVDSGIGAEKKPIGTDTVEVDMENSNGRSDELGSSSERQSGRRSVERLQLMERREIPELNPDDSAPKPDEKSPLDVKTEAGESGKDSDFSIVSSQQSIHEEEDLGWDEIEDLSSIDDKKVTSASSASKDDLRKRLTVADEEDDLSWDIEDDEPVKG